MVSAVSKKSTGSWLVEEHTLDEYATTKELVDIPRQASETSKGPKLFAPYFTGYGNK